MNSRLILYARQSLYDFMDLAVNEISVMRKRMGRIFFTWTSPRKEVLKSGPLAGFKATKTSRSPVLEICICAGRTLELPEALLPLSRLE